MRKSRKFVPITKAKGRLSAAIEVPVAVEGATRILTCHRSPAQISFSLGPPLRSGEAPVRAKPSKGNLLAFPRRATDSENDQRSTTRPAVKAVLKTKLVQQERDAKRYQLLRDYLLRNGIIHHVALSTDESEPFVLGATFYGQTFEQAINALDPNRS